MNAKYADIASTEETIEYIEDLPDDLFELPKGA